ncbi:hypothetical protein FACS1894105_11730 [Clostridia bacterium]|nr:hypothetical protein FACS1894105_11730 [Clostridia bacterium]
MDKYNSEHYRDPTAQLALSAKPPTFAATKSYLPLVYIASPFAGDVERNVYNARAYSRFALNHGMIPLAPHLLYPQIMDDNVPAERKLALKFAKILLGKCDMLFVFGDVITEGMAAEIAKAQYREMPTRYFSVNCCKQFITEFAENQANKY